jgi:hypothetical protein
MPQFIFAYHGGKLPETPEEGEKVMQAWGDWIESTGKAMVNPGNPVSKSRTVHPGGNVTDDGGPDPLMGFSIVNAATIEDAAEIAKSCPQLDAGGTIEIAELIEM